MSSEIIEKMKNSYFKRKNFSNLKEMLYSVMVDYESKVAFNLKNSNGEIYNVTYKEFANDVIALGTKLLNLGFLGKKIAVTGKNSYNWAISYLAACIVGVVVPIDRELHYTDVINFLNISEASCILGDIKNLQEIIKNQSQLNSDILYISFDEVTETSNLKNISTIKNDGFSLLDTGNTEFKDLELDSNELHFLLFTSGTTGNAKGVCLSHQNICSNIFSVGSIVKVDTSTKVLSILPIHHTYECTLGFLLVISSGGSVSYCEGLRYISKNIAEYKPSFILSVPLLLENVHKKILKSLSDSLPKKYFKEDKHIMDTLPFFMKFIVKKKIQKSLGGNLKKFIVGAAAISPALIESFNKFGITVLQGYGLTECSPLVAGNNDFFVKADSVGLPIPNVEYKIDNPDSEGIGEIIVKGPNVMLGYYKDEFETRQVLRDGWFYTGDLGKIDENGYLYITGRCKSVIITKNGKNVYPEELEFHLMENEFVEEALVLGRFDKNKNETVVNAQIYPNYDLLKESLNKTEIDYDDLNNVFTKVIQDVNKKLPNYKHIKEFGIREEEFEKTTTKKIKRYGENLNI